MRQPSVMGPRIVAFGPSILQYYLTFLIIPKGVLARCPPPDPLHLIEDLLK